MTIKTSNKYYIKNNYIFSDICDEISLKERIKFDNFDLKNNNLIDNNKLILDKLDEIFNRGDKILKISGIIENFDEINTKISKKNKKEMEEEFQIPKEDDYDFIEKTSQLDILRQLSYSYDGKDYDGLKSKTKEYVKDNKLIEEKKNKQLNEQIADQEKITASVKQRIDEFNAKNIQLIKDKINQTKKKIKDTEKEKEMLELLFTKKDDINVKKEEITKYRKKIEKHNFKIEDNELGIEILKAKISQIEDSIKLGRKKCPSLLLMVITLGFIYWSDFSNCNNKKIRLKNKISSIKEKNLIIQRKIHKIESKIKICERDLKKESADYAKKLEEVHHKAEELDNKRKDYENKIATLSKDLEVTEKKLMEIEKKYDEYRLELDKLKRLKKEFNDFSLKKILEKLEEFDKQRMMDVDTIETYKSKLKKQSIKIDGEWIIDASKL